MTLKNIYNLNNSKYINELAINLQCYKAEYNYYKVVDRNKALKYFALIKETEKKLEVNKNLFT